MTVATKSVLQIKSGPLQKQSVLNHWALSPALVDLFIYWECNCNCIPKDYVSLAFCSTSASYQHSLKLNVHVSAVAKHCWCSSSTTLPSKQTAGMHLHSYPVSTFPSLHEARCHCVTHADSALLSVCGAWTWALWCAKDVEPRAWRQLSSSTIRFLIALRWCLYWGKNGCLGKAGWPGRSQDLPIWAPYCWSYRQDSLELLR